MYGLELYDFHARQYDPQIGRFLGVDPLADKFLGMSPYAGMGNNPVMYVDPDGMFKISFSGEFLNENGITDVKKFGTFILNFQKKIEDFGNTASNSDVIHEIHRTTGLSKTRIKQDLKAGSGTAITLQSSAHESQSPLDNSMVLYGVPLVEQFKAKESGNYEEAYYQEIANLMYFLHEYGHLGDKITNNGSNSGQTDQKICDLEVSTRPDLQRPKAHTGHRGSDIDHQTMYYYKTTKNSPSFSEHDFSFWEGATPKLTQDFINKVKKSKRFGSYEKK